MHFILRSKTLRSKLHRLFVHNNSGMFRVFNDSDEDFLIVLTTPTGFVFTYQNMAAGRSSNFCASHPYFILEVFVKGVLIERHECNRRTHRGARFVGREPNNLSIDGRPILAAYRQQFPLC